MPNKIKPKRSYTANSVPLTTDLEQNELAINWADGKAFTKNASGQIVSVTLGGSGGSSSSEDTALRAFFLPTAPTNVVATAGNGQASVTWTASTTIAQIPVIDYVVQFSSNGGTSWTTFSDGTSTSTSATVTGLTNGTAYTFRVAGVNGVGTGAYSTASSAVTPSAATDPNFSSVSLLLHMDGSGSTFVDSSGTPKAITANGGATQSADQSKWGGKSGLFNGTTSRLEIPSSSDLNLPGDFTIEAWVYPLSLPSSGRAAIAGKWGAGQQYAWLVQASATEVFAVIAGGNSISTTVSGSHSLALNSWSHIAVTRSSGTLRYFVNGSVVASGSDGGRSASSTAPVWVGSQSDFPEYFNGYIDDFRITQGVARTITVPTAPFPDA